MSVTAQLADGRTLEFPDGTDPAVVQSTVKKMLAPAAAAPTPQTSLLDRGLSTAKDLAMTGPETALSLGSGALGAVAGGWAGLAQGAKNLVSPGMPAGDRVRQVQDAMTYQPRGIGGQTAVGAISYPFQKLAEGADYLGGKTTDVTGSPMLGAAVNTAVQSLPMAVSPLAARMKAGPGISPEAMNARALGLKVTPDEAGAGVISKTLAGLSGEPKLAKLISKENQPVYNKMIAKDLGLPADAELSREALADVRAKAGKPYEEARNAGRVQMDGQYITDLQNVSREYAKAQIDFPGRKSSVLDLVDRLQTKSADAGSIVSEIKLLQKDATKAFADRDWELGSASLDAVKALQSQLERHLIKTGQSADLVKEMRDSRVTIAKAHAAEKALNDATGDINPQYYAKQLEKGKPLTGGALDVGQFAQGFPRSAQKTSNLGSTGPTYFDLAMGAFSHELPLLLARPAARVGLASTPGQAMMENPSLASLLAEMQGKPITPAIEMGQQKRQP